MSSTATAATAPRAWIGCLACYNDGRLVGDWFPAEIADDVTLAEVHARHGGTRVGCEELLVMDTDYMPVSREMSPSEAADWGRAWADVDEWMRDAWITWVRECEITDPPSMEDFLDAYAGEWDSWEDFAVSLVDDLGMLASVPDWAAQYFDYVAWARDLAYDYTTAAKAHCPGVFVFRNC